MTRLPLADPAAGERLLAAARAAGLESIEDLVNLVVDSGAIATPPSDGVTEVYTLQDLGAALWAQMPPTGRPEWFAGLVDTQKAAIITMLRTRGYSAMVVGRDFGLPELEVQQIYNRHVDDLGGQVINVRLNTLVGHLQLAAERASEGAMAKEDWSTYWRVQREMIGVLQSLGIVKQAIRKVEIAHKFEDQQKAEVDALLDIERKKRLRQEEIKRIEVEFDAVPALALPDGATSMSQPYTDDEV